jgi:hypothetical protein
MHDIHFHCQVVITEMHILSYKRHLDETTYNCPLDQDDLGFEVTNPNST